MFRASTILMKLVQSLAKVTLLLKHSVQIRRCILCGDVAACREMVCVLFVVLSDASCGVRKSPTNICYRYTTSYIILTVSGNSSYQLQTNHTISRVNFRNVFDNRRKNNSSTTLVTIMQAYVAVLYTTTQLIYM